MRGQDQSEVIRAVLCKEERKSGYFRLEDDLFLGPLRLVDPGELIIETAVFLIDSWLLRRNFGSGRPSCAATAHACSSPNLGGLRPRTPQITYDFSRLAQSMLNLPHGLLSLTHSPGSRTFNAQE
jgi:hypothetical protein